MTEMRMPLSLLSGKLWSNSINNTHQPKYNIIVVLFVSESGALRAEGVNHDIITVYNMSHRR